MRTISIMTLYSEAPRQLPFNEIKPTLLVCWWATIFCGTIILFRLAGRYIRTERLFPEDKMAALALLPLFLRMGCVHVVLTCGTNNVNFNTPLADKSDEALYRKSVGSGMVLASRIFHAATLWLLKNTALEFFSRLVGVTWTPAYMRMIQFIRAVLLITFIGIVISTFAECSPVSNYWSVLPDPGGACRQAYVQLITMAVCNILTDLLLVLFPVPIILASVMPVKRKVRLVLLFSLSIFVIAITIFRVPRVIKAQGWQPLRSLLASIELLFATSAANALVLGSFVRDRGLKKRRYKHISLSENHGDHLPGCQPLAIPLASPSRRPTAVALRQWGSDEDLVRDVGLNVGVDKALLDDPERALFADLGTGWRYKPANAVTPDMNAWCFPHRGEASGSGSGGGAGQHAMRSPDFSGSGEIFGGAQRHSLIWENVLQEKATSPRKVDFFDVGGLLSDERIDPAPASAGIGASTSKATGTSSGTGTGMQLKIDGGSTSVNLMSSRRGSHFHGSDRSISPKSKPVDAPTPVRRASGTGFRRGSLTLLHDLSGLLPRPVVATRPSCRNSLPECPVAATELRPMPRQRQAS